MTAYQVRWMIEDEDVELKYWRPATATEVREGKAVLSVYRQGEDRLWMWQADFRTEAGMRRIFGNKVVIDPVED